MRETSASVVSGNLHAWPGSRCKCLCHSKVLRKGERANPGISMAEHFLSRAIALSLLMLLCLLASLSNSNYLDTARVRIRKAFATVWYQALQYRT